MASPIKKKVDQARKSSGLRITKRKGYWWILLPDAINMDNYEQVENGIESIFSAGGDRLVIDLADTKNMYSAGFGLLVRLRKRVVSSNGEIHLINASEKVLDGLRAVGLDKIMPVYSEEEIPSSLR